MPGQVGAGGGSSGANSGLVRQATKTLTDAQVKALPSTAVQILASQGANKVIVPMTAILMLNWVVDYGNIAATSRIFIRSETDNANILARLAEDVQGAVSSLLALGSNAFVFLAQESALFATSEITSGEYSAWTIANFANRGLEIKATNGVAGDFNGGNAGNSLVVSVPYTIFNTTTGQFE